MSLPARSPRFRSAALSRLLDAFQARRPLRAGSLLVTTFGDAIAPHGGTVWLGSLIQALAPFGVSERLVRTSIYRLAQDGWLSSEQLGRRSYYSLTGLGQRRFREASQHIYSEPRRNWSGSWCLVLLAAVPASDREGLRRELGWLGFAPLSANVLAHPDPDMAVFDDHVSALPGHELLVVSHAQVQQGRETAFNELVRNAWQLEELDQRYRAFLEQFRPVYKQLRSNDPQPDEAFQVRILLIHEYRKIILRDPLLPKTLLSEDWNGTAAYQLCRNLYHTVAPASADFISANMETAEGPLPPPDNEFWQRFGGLPDNTRDDS